MTTSAPSHRFLGRSAIETSPMGLGCWAIGGIWTLNGRPAGFTGIDDSESLRAIHAALDCGVNLFDTAANYGCGHSERILGRAVRGRRHRVVVVTKFGYCVNEAARTVEPYGKTEEQSEVVRYIRADLEASLRRLQTDYVDVFLLHVWGLALEHALAAREVLEALVGEGKIRTYGWSTDRSDAIRAFSTSPHCAVVEQQMSVLDGNRELLTLCEEWNLASLIRGPLGMSTLTGKRTADSTFQQDDVRRHVDWHPAFRSGRLAPEWLRKLDAIREILTQNGRTLAQGALAWLWARSAQAIPIPGFRTAAQVEENCGALPLGPLTTAQMVEIDGILSSFGSGL